MVGYQRFQNATERRRKYEQFSKMGYIVSDLLHVCNRLCDEIRA